MKSLICSGNKIQAFLAGKLNPTRYRYIENTPTDSGLSKPVIACDHTSQIRPHPPLMYHSAISKFQGLDKYK